MLKPLFKLVHTKPTLKTGSLNELQATLPTHMCVAARVLVCVCACMVRCVHVCVCARVCVCVCVQGPQRWGVQPS